MIKNILSNKTAVVYIEDPNNLLSLQQFHPCFDISFQPDEYVSPKQASKMLGVNINAIYDFAKRGFLPMEKLLVSRTARPIKLISKNHLEYFKKNYVLSKGINKNELANFQIISGPSVNNGIINLYIRRR